MSIFYCVQFLKMTLYTEIFTCIISLSFSMIEFWQKSLIIIIYFLHDRRPWSSTYYYIPKIDFLKIIQHRKKSNSNENHQVVWNFFFFHKSELHICNRWQMKDDLQLCGGWHLMLPNRGGGQKYTIKIL